MARAESVMTKRTFIRLRRRPPCLTSPPTRRLRSCGASPASTWLSVTKKASRAAEPLGPLVAQAATEGYTTANLTPPYHGYLLRILTEQGSSAPGGEFDHLAKGVMIGGFAIVAYPASYGVSGAMTFLISHDGVVYEKDLGPATAQLVPKMTRFDPGPGWQKVP